MKKVYFKSVGQIQTEKHVILVSILPKDFVKDLPSIFEIQGCIEPKTIYSGMYPTIKFNPDTVKDITAYQKGMGISGIVTNTEWYCTEREIVDTLGISLE